MLGNGKGADRFMKISEIKNKKICVFYHYFEANEIYIENFKYFLKSSYLEELDFNICISGECSVNLPSKKNITYHYVENKNNDYGAYCSVVPKIFKKNKYEAYLFINCSARGPFFEREITTKWYETFTKLLDNDTHLSGSSINMLSTKSSFVRQLPKVIGGYSHVQTYAYCLSSVALEALLEDGFYSIQRKLSKFDVIVQYELGLSRRILDKNWNISCILSKYKNLDFRQNPEDINPTSRSGDPLFKNAYFGKTVEHTEIIFVKTQKRRKLIKTTDEYKFTNIFKNIFK